MCQIKFITNIENSTVLLNISKIRTYEEKINWKTVPRHEHDECHVHEKNKTKQTYKTHKMITRLVTCFFLFQKNHPWGKILHFCDFLILHIQGLSQTFQNEGWGSK